MKFKYITEFPKQAFKILTKIQKIYMILFWFSFFALSIFETLGLGVLAAYVGILSNAEQMIEKIPYENLKIFLLEIEFNDLILFIGIIIIVLFLIKNILIIFVNIFELKLRKNIESEISKKIFSNIIEKPYLYHASTGSPQVINEVMNESSRVVNLIFGYNTFYKEMTLIIILFIPLMIFNPLIFFAIIIIFSLFSFLFFKKIRSKLIYIGDKIKKHSELQFKSIKEVIENIILVKLSGKKFFFINKYLNQYNLVMSKSISKRIYSLFPRMFFENISVITIVLVSCILIFSDMKNETIISYLSFIALAAIRLVPAFTNLNLNFTNIIYNEKPFENYVKAINLKKNENYFLKKENDEKLIQIKKIESIELKNIYFKYKDEKEYIFEDISLKIDKKIMIGIIGRSGSGKSTLSKILMGLLPPNQGEVEINCNNLKTIQSNWKKRIGYISQDVFLSENSLMKNIAMSQDNLEIDIKQINYSINNALLGDLVKNSQEGLEFLISGTGDNVSGGQKQRIGIARAIYSNPDLLILDEPTSNLDLESKNLLNKCLQEIKKNKIVLLITHSDEMLENCDIVYEIINKKLLNVKKNNTKN